MDTGSGNSFLKIVGFTLAAVVVAAGWLWLCDAMKWNRLGWAGLALGVLIGLAFWVGNRTSRGFTAGVFAALVAGAAIGISHDRSLQQHPEEGKNDISGDDSFIRGLVEQKLAEQAATLAKSGELPPNLAFGAPVVNSRSEVPERIWKEASDQWKALPEAIKQQIRQQRAHWVQQSRGPNWERPRENTRWLFKVVMVFAVSVIALVLGAAPALVDRTREVFA
jgi:hypothetical protein